MSKKRKQHPSEFKAKVALAAIRGDETCSLICGHNELHVTIF